MPNTDSSQAAFTQRRRGIALGVFHAANPDNNRNGPQSTIPGSVYHVIQVGNASIVGPTATVPDAPTDVSATPGNAQATVTFTAPTNDDGVIYTVTSSPGGFTATGTTSPIVVTGLTNGTAYTFTVVATNEVGPSNPSSASSPVTPATVPDAPTIGTATPGSTQASVTFTAPTNNGGATITSYTVTSSPGGFTASDASSPIVVPGLINGIAYTFTVTATNSAGTSTASSASNQVTPAATAPGAPTGVIATAGNAQASVAFMAPTNDGGSDITSYTVTSTPGSRTATGASSPLIVTGLTNGVNYMFRVVATNSIGPSAVSAASSAVTPATVPDAPTGVSALPGNTQADVGFTTPTSNGGAAITSYTVTSDPGGFTASGSLPLITVRGLTNDIPYTFTVVATNRVGSSVSSSASTAVTPNSLTRPSFMSGSGTWTVPAGVTSVNYLVVGGGGGGGGGVSTGAGGGGGGGSVKTGTLSVTPGDELTYTVGAGGGGGIGNASTSGDGTAGGDSSFATIIAKGGGRGYNNYDKNSSLVYGHGGSGQSGDTPTTGGSGGGLRDNTQISQGPPIVYSSSGAGGGGGGAGGDGITSPPNPQASTAGVGDNTRGGLGGPGISSNLLDGTARTYGAGGKGADEGTSTFISQGTGARGASGAVNTGNGGGGGASHSGSGNGNPGGAGGSGIVVITYQA
jgi:hypothetical protein